MKIILLKLLKNTQMGKVKVVNRVDMLSFAISSEEEDAERVDADSHSDSSSEDELVKLEVRPTRQFPRHRTEPQEPTRKNARQNAGKPSSPHHLELYLNLLFKKMHHETTLYTLLCVLLHSTQRSMGPLYESTCMQELINKVFFLNHKLYFA